MTPARRLLHLAACAAALAGLPVAASALDYPTRPVHIVVGFPPGQNADIGARLIGDFLSQKLGQTFVIDNKPGAASTIGRTSSSDQRDRNMSCNLSAKRRVSKRSCSSRMPSW